MVLEGFDGAASGEGVREIKSLRLMYEVIYSSLFKNNYIKFMTKNKEYIKIFKILIISWLSINRPLRKLAQGNLGQTSS